MLKNFAEKFSDDIRGKQGRMLIVGLKITWAGLLGYT